MMKNIKNILSKINFKAHPRFSAIETNLFFRQLATLISAGIPFVQSCDILEKMQEREPMRMTLAAIKKDVQAGKTLYSVLQCYPFLFNEICCHLIQVGEQAGQLDHMLHRIAQYQEESLAFKGKIKKILFYPFIVTLITLGITLFMFIFIIPRFAELFQNTPHQLPLLTRTLLSVSTLLQNHFPLLCSLFTALVFLTLHYGRNPKVRSSLIYHAVKLPLLGTFFTKIILARFAKTLAITLAAGLPIIDSLKLSSPTSYPHFSKITYKLRSKIASGLPLYQAMETLHFFPTIMIQMTKIGEETGMLATMLEKVAHFFEADINHILHQFGQILEPLIMVILGVLIGGIVIGMYLPLFKLGSTI